MREHDRTERRRIARLGPRALALQPGEEFGIRRLQPVPDLLDLVGRNATEAGRGRLGQAGGDTDA